MHELGLKCDGLIACDCTLCRLFMRRKVDYEVGVRGGVDINEATQRQSMRRQQKGCGLKGIL